MNNLPTTQSAAYAAPTSGVYFVQPTSIFSEFWTLLKRRWLMASVVTLLLTTCIVLVLLAIAPRYRATAQVMIQARKSEVVKVDPVLGTLPSDSDTVPSELHVMQSRDLVTRLVGHLRLDAKEEFDPNAASIWRHLLESGAKLAQPWIPVPITREPLEGQARRDAVVDEVTRHFEVAQVGRSRVISISFSSTDRALASAAANGLAELYVSQQGEIKQLASSEANRWIMDNLSRLADTAAAAAKRVADFKTDAHEDVGRGRSHEGHRIGNIGLFIVLTKFGDDTVNGNTERFLNLILIAEATIAGLEK